MFAGLLMIALAQAAPPPHVANGDQAEGGRLHVGSTGIRCVTTPCPTRGVFAPDAQGHAVRNALLYADLDGKGPPPMTGDYQAVQTIAKAWEDHQCLAIEGRLIPGKEDRPVLRVDRIIGPCRDQG